MNKRILGLLFIFCLVAIPAQAANLNNELNAAFARRTAANRRAVPQVIVNVDPVPVVDNPVPVAAEVINVDPAPVNNPIPQPIPEEIIDIDAVPVVEAEEIIAQQPNQAGGFRRFLGGIFGYGAPIVNNPEDKQDNPAQVTANVNPIPSVNNQDTAEKVFICNICENDISPTATDDQKLEQTSCKHNFHLGCLEEHKTMVGETCPECEEDIKKVPIHQCPICIEDILDEDDTDKKMVGTPCQHFFHTNCLALACQAAREAGGQEKCPICRTALNTVAAPIERAAATEPQIRAIERQHAWQVQQLQDQVARLEGERRNNNGNQLPEDNIPHQIPVQQELENQGGRNISIPKSIALVATGAATVSFIPGAPESIKSELTTATTKVCEVISKYPKETAGIAAITALGYSIARGTNAKEVVEFANNHADSALIIASGLTLAGLIVANK